MRRVPRGDHVHCPTWKRSHIDPGGMAEWIRVPAVNVRSDTFAVNDLHPEQAVFIEPLACSVKALLRLRGLLPLPGRRRSRGRLRYHGAAQHRRRQGAGRP